jgi:DNA polymerase III subunit beta
MKIEFLSENIEVFIPTLSKIIPVHSQIPVLANLLIEATSKGIFISSTNLETGVKIRILGKVEEEGVTTVPGKQFLEALSSLPKDKVFVTLEKGSLKLKCRNSNVSFQTIAAEEFPGIYEDEGEKVLDFSEEDLKTTFSSLLFVSSLDESRPELTGVLFAQGDEGVDFVTTDGFRLSLKKLKGKKMTEDELILPARLVAEAMALRKASSLYINKTANQAIFKTEDVTLVGRFISGNFPKYGKVIPAQGRTTMVFDAQDFSQKLKLVSIFARESANVVQVKIENNKITMKAQAAGVGEGEMEVEGRQEGDVNEIAFNIKFLADFLKNTEAKEITLKISSPIEPALFKVDNDPDFLHVIMPVRVDN